MELLGLSTFEIVCWVIILVCIAFMMAYYLYRFCKDLRRKPDEKKDNPLAIYTQYVKKKDAPIDNGEVENVDDDK